MSIRKLLGITSESLQRSWTFSAPKLLSITSYRTAATTSSSENSLHRTKVPVETTERLRTFGQYVADCLPKYVQRVMIQHGNFLVIN